MEYDSQKHRRRSIRLRGYNYARPGRYFVTSCIRNRECLFGEIRENRMQINDAGNVVANVWNELPNKFPSIKLDSFIVMPNHIHGIIVIKKYCRGNTCRGNASIAPTKTNKMIDPPTLGDIMRVFKSISAIKVNLVLERTGMPLWQRNYYEHIIRNDAEWNSISEYISDNPLCWEQDEENPDMHNP